MTGIYKGRKVFANFGRISILPQKSLLIGTTYGPFPNYLLPLFQNESSSKTFHIKMSLICMEMNMSGRHVFILMVSHGGSF